MDVFPSQEESLSRALEDEKIPSTEGEAEQSADDGEIIEEALSDISEVELDVEAPSTKTAFPNEPLQETKGRSKADKSPEKKMWLALTSEEKLPVMPPKATQGELEAESLDKGPPRLTRKVSDDSDSDSEEDLDEDILYLRLMALRSMAPEMDDEKIQEAVGESEELTKEMVELLDEVDEAAASVDQERSCVGDVPVRANGTVAKKDLSTIMRRLQSLLHSKSSSSQAVYTPSQSPSTALDSDAAESGAAINGLNHDSPLSSASEAPLFDMEERLDKRGTFLTGLSAAREIVLESIARSEALGLESNLQLEDMELASDTEEGSIGQGLEEADTEKLFPPSVWMFQPGRNRGDTLRNQRCLKPIPLLESDTSENSNSNVEQVGARKRKVSPSDAEQPPKKLPRESKEATGDGTSNDSDDEASLREHLLKSMRGAKAASQKARSVASSAEMPRMTQIPSVPTVNSRRVQVPPALPRAFKLSPQTHSGNIRVVKPPKQQRAPAPSAASSKKKSSRGAKALQKLLLAAKGKKKILEASKLMNTSIMLAHFPNLVKSVIIPLGVESDEEEPKQSPLKPAGSSPAVEFSLQLDQLLREGRQNSKPSSGNPPGIICRPPEPIPVQVAAKQTKGAPGSISKKAKASLMTQNISHLPQAKQREYLKLREMILKREQKKLGLAAAAQARKSASREGFIAGLPLPVAAVAAVVERGPVALVQVLPDIQCMKDGDISASSDVPSAMNTPKIDATVTSGSVTETAVGKLTGTCSDTNCSDQIRSPQNSLHQHAKGSRQIQRNSIGRQQIPQANRLPNAQPQPPKQQSKVLNPNGNSRQIAKEKKSPQLNESAIADLSGKEVLVITKRSEVTSDLYKLSAQMSTLRADLKRQTELETFVSDLEKQLSQAREMLTRRKEHVSTVRQNVVVTQKEVSLRRGELKQLEADCLSVGRAQRGTAYRVPTEGYSEMINKFGSIEKTAKLISSLNVTSSPKPGKPAASAASDTKPPSVPSPTLPPPSVPPPTLGIPSLAHLRSQRMQLDPNAQLCPFELQGKCNDAKCSYQHTERGPASDRV